MKNGLLIFDSANQQSDECANCYFAFSKYEFYYILLFANFEVFYNWKCIIPKHRAMIKGKQPIKKTIDDELEAKGTLWMI
jgi:hypothetical protein